MATEIQTETNKITEKSPTDETNQPRSELAQLREIVFGEAQRSLQAQQEQIFNDLQEKIENLSTSLNHSIDSGFKALEQDITQLDKKLSAVDIDHHERSDILKSDLEQLNADLSAQSDQTANEIDKLHHKLASDISTLSTDLQKQISELVAQLAQVSGNLDSSKTDRKLLAQLFNTVAVNLEKADPK
jgi:hypothetical protein